jgi:hypothetical protein
MTLISRDRLRDPKDREHDIGEASAIRYFERERVFRKIKTFMRGRSIALSHLTPEHRKEILEGLKKCFDATPEDRKL